ncbi:MAG: hypothetical protein M0026_07925 [Nocardiopsaceae bacterium]|nr:hypothetical protein [Nocardiopsaceae bacterium]
MTSLSATIALLWHESRRCGLAVWALPVAGAAVGGAVSGLPSVARSALLLASYSALACLAALCVVAVLGRARMLELHLSLPVPVPVLVARRLAVVAVSTAVAGAAGSLALVFGAGTEGALGAAAGAGTVLCTAALLSGVALWTWARWHSAAAASGALIAVWLGYALFWAANIPPGVNRPVCAVMGALLIWRGLRSLTDPDRVLAKEER